MLINLTNHPYDDWSKAQKAAASAYGACVDIAFPNVDPYADDEEIRALADEYAERVQVIGEGADATVHIMGEQTLCFALISRLSAMGIPCIASCTERDVTMLEDGTKSVRFHFVRFRQYTN